MDAYKKRDALPLNKGLITALESASGKSATVALLRAPEKSQSWGDGQRRERRVALTTTINGAVRGLQDFARKVSDGTVRRGEIDKARKKLQAALAVLDEMERETASDPPPPNPA